MAIESGVVSSGADITTIAVATTNELISKPKADKAALSMTHIKTADLNKVNLFFTNKNFRSQDSLSPTSFSNINPTRLHKVSKSTTPSQKRVAEVSKQITDSNLPSKTKSKYINKLQSFVKMNKILILHFNLCSEVTNERSRHQTV